MSAPRGEMANALAINSVAADRDEPVAGFEPVSVTLPGLQEAVTERQIVAVHHLGAGQPPMFGFDGCAGCEVDRTNGFPPAPNGLPIRTPFDVLAIDVCEQGIHKCLGSGWAVYD